MSSALIQTDGLSMEFKGFRAVSDVHLSVRRGTIHGIIGPNGAGKTTLFNLLTKFLTPTAGRIVLDGIDITTEKPEAVAKRGIIRSFQISAVFPKMTALQNIRVALLSKAGYAADFWRNGASLRQFDKRSRELLGSVGIELFADVPAQELSYGRRRSLELAATLALDPKVLLLDEPTQGMAHEDVDQVVELIRKVARGRTVILVEHNMGVVARLCDRITVLQRGEILAEGTYAEVSENPDVRAAYIGDADPEEVANAG